MQALLYYLTNNTFLLVADHQGPLPEIPAGAELETLIKRLALQLAGWGRRVETASVTAMLLPRRGPEPRLPKEMPEEKGLILSLLAKMLQEG